MTEAKSSGDPESRAALLRELNAALATRKISSDLHTQLARFGSIFSGLGALAFVALSAAGVMSNDARSQFVFILVLALGALFTFSAVAAWRLADEVLDCGDALLARKGRVQQRILFSEIDDIHVWIPSRPPTIAICLKSPGPFGSTITFLPLQSSFLGYSTPVPRELMSKVLQARRSSGG